MERRTQFLCCCPGQFSSAVSFCSRTCLSVDMPLEQSQSMSVEPRRKDECSVSRASRVLSSTLRGNTSRAASALAVLVLY